MRMEPDQPVGPSFTGARPQPAHRTVRIATVQHAVAIAGVVGRSVYQHTGQCTDGSAGRPLDTDTTASRNGSTLVHQQRQADRQHLPDLARPAHLTGSAGLGPVTLPSEHPVVDGDRPPGVMHRPAEHVVARLGPAPSAATA